MEATLNKLSAEDPAIKEEQRAESDSVDDTEKMLLFQVGNRNMHNTSKPAVPSNRNNLRIMNQVDQLESAKSKMSAVNEENERLKMMIDRVVKEHRSLQTHMLDIVKQEQAKTLAHVNSPESEDPRHLFLGLGRNPSIIKDENKGLVPGLESKITVSESFRTKDDESRTGLRRLGSEEGELPEQKKTRVSVRVRCEGATMNDGCQWRKYGQKISKGNPCPRAYYRCTVGPTCPVRKQVQRCAEDMSILTTTYEGTHNHQLPMSATAMASSTSAAAYMIRSGSTSSNQVPGSSSSVFPGLSYNHLPNPNNALPQFYTPAPSFSSLSSHPTITLDLTNSPPSSSLFPPYLHNTPSAPASFNFSSHRDQVPYDKNRPLGYVNHGRQNQLPVQQSLSTSSSNQTIAAATKAITSHPSFQMALEAAITSFIGGGAKRIRDGEDNSMGMLMKRSESLPVNTSTTIDWNHISSSSEGRERSLMFLPPPSLPSSSTKRGSESPPEDKKHKL